MDSLLENPVSLSAQVTEALKMEHVEQNIGGGYK